MSDLPEVEFSIWCEDRQRAVPCIVLSIDSPAAKENRGLAIQEQRCLAALYSLDDCDLFAKMTVSDLMNNLADVIYAFVPKDLSDGLKTISAITLH